MTLLEVLKGIEIPDEIGVYEETDELNAAADAYVSKVLRISKLEGLAITYHYGASQLCFIEDGANSVYKIPFDGQVEEWSEYNEETDEDEWHEHFAHFQYNYTAKTEEVYNYAEEAELEKFFAEIHVAGYSFNHQPIWEQQYVTPRGNQSTSHHPSDDSMRKAKEIAEKRYIQFEKDWTAVCIDMYGLDRFQQLLQFFDEYGLEDFHWNNYGWDKEGRPKLLDYAGYSG